METEGGGRKREKQPWDGETAASGGAHRMFAHGKFLDVQPPKESSFVQKAFFLLPLRCECGGSSRICVRHQTHSVCSLALLGWMITLVGWAGIKRRKKIKLTNKVCSWSK